MVSSQTSYGTKGFTDRHPLDGQHKKVFLDLVIDFHNPLGHLR